VNEKKFQWLTLATTLVGLLDRFDDTDSDGLPHVTDGETTKWRVLVVRFNTAKKPAMSTSKIVKTISRGIPHRLGGDEFGDASITGFDEFGIILDRLSTPTIDFLDELGKLAGNVGGVAIKDGSVAGTNLTRMVEYNDLSIEGSGLFSGVIFGVRAHISTTNILN